MNNERDIIMNTQPYAEDLGVDPSDDGDEIKTGSKTNWWLVFGVTFSIVWFAFMVTLAIVSF